jgi:hypothetical protein
MDRPRPCRRRGQSVIAAADLALRAGGQPSCVPSGGGCRPDVHRGRVVEEAIEDGREDDEVSGDRAPDSVALLASQDAPATFVGAEPRRPLVSAPPQPRSHHLQLR